MPPDTKATIEKLITKALAEPADSDERWGNVRALQALGDQSTFDAAVKLCKSSKPARRELGVDVLASLGIPGPTYEINGVTLGAYADDRPFRGPAVEVVLDLLNHERNPRVIKAIAMAFAHLEDDRGIEPLSRLRHHESKAVRYGVVHGLLTHDDDVAVDALVELSSDPDSDIRDWATFGLGSQIERDTPQIRDALVARLGDLDQDTREDAILGLALRGDMRATEPLLALLDDGWEGPTLDEALYNLCARIDNERLTPYLTDLWTKQRVRPEFAPSTPDDKAVLLAAARRYGLTDATTDDA